MKMKDKKTEFKLPCAFAPSRLRVEKSFLIFAFLILFSLGVFAQSSTNQLNETSAMPADFESDGCSGFPDFDYTDCCFEHDKTYYFGGSWTKRWRADKKLFKCVAAKEGFEHKLIAPMMWVGVRAFGVPFLPTSFRWGFGKVKKKANDDSRIESKKENKNPSNKSKRKKPESKS